MKNKGTIAITQILLLLVGIVAMTYIIGSGIGIVSASDKILGDACGNGGICSTSCGNKEDLGNLCASPLKCCKDLPVETPPPQQSSSAGTGCNEAIKRFSCSSDARAVLECRRGEWITFMTCVGEQICSPIKNKCVKSSDYDNPPEDPDKFNFLGTLGTLSAIGGGITGTVEGVKYVGGLFKAGKTTSVIAKGSNAILFDAAHGIGTHGTIAVPNILEGATLGAGGGTSTVATPGLTGSVNVVVPEAIVPEVIVEGGTKAFFTQAAGIAISAAIAVAVGLLARYIGEAAGLSVSQAQALGWAAAGGTFAALAISSAELFGLPLGFSIIGSGTTGILAGLSTAWIPVVGVLVSTAIFLLTFKKESVEVVNFQCGLWDAQKGGDDCELCNKQSLLPCTEYQCRSLGRSCELIDGPDGDDLCVYVGKNDVDYPAMEPWEDVLLENYEYTPDGRMSPPDRGVYVDYTKSSDKCVPAFTPITFGVTLDEPAKCKISPVRTPNFEEMGDFYLSGRANNYSHLYTTSMPGARAAEAENISLENGGNYEFFFRCEDKKGNSNVAEFVFKFCVDDGPDLETPTIMRTNPLNKAPISFGTTSTDMYAYLNKPSDCRWSRLNQDYEDMENEMVCSQSITEMNAQRLYACKTNLDNLKDSFENKFYFRCKSYPTLDESERIVMSSSYEYSLIGTQPLIIDSIKINGKENGSTIEDSTEAVQATFDVVTSAGYNEGQAYCYYSATGDDNDYSLFFDTNSYQHSQILWPIEGDYKYYIKCIDLGGNADVKTINFHVESDTEYPIIVRAYYESNYLKVITDEAAKCRYGTSDNLGCDYNFEEGTLMLDTADGLEHSVSWNSDTNFYIKCGEAREGGIDPPMNACSMTIRPFDIYSE